MASKQGFRIILTDWIGILSGMAKDGIELSQTLCNAPDVK
jgi:hypothetical protein